MPNNNQVKRREFLKLTSLASTGLIFGFAACKTEIKNKTELDRFGGWTGKKLTKTGFFHTEHDGQRWWFVTPEGNAFLSFGVNHYHDGWWIQNYNRDHWVNTFGAKEPRDEKWNEGFRKVATADLDRLGINTLGWHTDALMLTDKPYEAVVPYLRSFKPIVLDHYRNPTVDAFMDVFAPEFEKLCDKTAKNVAAPYKDDPMLLGYCMSDCPIFTDNDIRFMGVTSWSRVLPNLDSDSLGKQAYVALMKKHYSEIKDFNSNYESNFSSWDDLAKTKDWKPNKAPKNDNEKADNEAFTLLCVDRYYAVSKAAIQKYDPNHLFLGDKLNGNTDNLERVLEVAAKHVDVIVYQFYGTYAEQIALLDKLTPKVKIPFMNGDIGFTVSTETMPNPHGPHAKDQAERADWLIESVNGCFARPEFIGWHMCGIIDTWQTMPTKEHAQHQGLMTVTGEYYPEMEDAVKQISDQMYQWSVTDVK